MPRMPNVLLKFPMASLIKMGLEFLSTPNEFLINLQRRIRNSTSKDFCQNERIRIPVDFPLQNPEAHWKDRRVVAGTL